MIARTALETSCPVCGVAHRKGSGAYQKCLNLLEQDHEESLRFHRTAEATPPMDRTTDRYELSLIKRIRSAEVTRKQLASQRSRTVEQLGRAGYYVRLAASRVTLNQFRSAVVKRQRQVEVSLARSLR